MARVNWADGNIDYKELHTVMTEAVACFAHNYAYGVSECTFLTGLKGRPMHNLHDLECPHPSLLIRNAGVHCHVTTIRNLLAKTKQRIPSTIG